MKSRLSRPGTVWPFEKQNTTSRQSIRAAKKGTNMKSITSILCALAFLGSVALANAETCCEKAKAAGKDCAHKCCVAAKKEGKVCEKCNPKKEDK